MNKFLFYIPSDSVVTIIAYLELVKSILPMPN